MTVTTTAATSVAMSGPLRGDITDGASVMVRGHSSGGMITAAIVTVGPPFSAVDPPGFVPVQGTVSDPNTAGFTLVTSSGTRIPVTTSGGTLVVVPHASPGQLRAGAAIFAVGAAGPDGTLSARGVAASPSSGQGRTSACRSETARPPRSPTRSARSARRPSPAADRQTQGSKLATSSTHP